MEFTAIGSQKTNVKKMIINSSERNILYNVCAVPSDVHYRAGYHDKCGDILSYMGVSVPWGISGVLWGLS